MCALLFLLHAAVTTQKMASDATVSALWRLNVYGAMLQNSKVSGFHHAKLLEIEYKSFDYFSALCNNIFARS